MTGSRAIVGPNDPQPAPRFECGHCGAGYFGEKVAEQCCDGWDILQRELTQ